jgi:hypothetical protein
MSKTPSTTKANSVEPGWSMTSKTLDTTKANNIEPG